MLIEIIGPSGAGKTKIAGKIIRLLLKQPVGIFTVHPDFFPFKPKVFGRPTNQTLQNLNLDLLALKTILGSYKKNKPLIDFAAMALRKYADSRLTGLNLFRGVCRKIGLAQYVRESRFKNNIVIVDEGLTHAVHNLFVHFGNQHCPEDLRDFSNLFPLPDLILYIKSPVQLLLQHSQSRSDLSRRLRGRNMELFLNRADQVFDEFIGLKKIREKTLILENTEDNINSIDQIAQKATDHILRIWKNGHA